MYLLFAMIAVALPYLTEGATVFVFRRCSSRLYPMLLSQYGNKNISA